MEDDLTMLRCMLRAAIAIGAILLIPGSIINVFALHKPLKARHRSGPFIFLLLHQSVFDLLTMSVTNALLICENYVMNVIASGMDMPAWSIKSPVIYIFEAFYTISTRGNLNYLALVGFERACCVGNPFWHRRYFTNKLRKQLLVIVWLVTLSLASLRITAENQVMDKDFYTEFYNNAELFIVIQDFVITGAILLAWGYITYKLRVTSKKRSKLASSNKDVANKRASAGYKIFFVNLTLFLLCSLPSPIFKATYRKDSLTLTQRVLIKVFSNVMLLIQSTVNPILTLRYIRQHYKTKST